MKNNWKGKNVLVVGAARQGISASRFLVNQGAFVTLNDRQPSKELDPLVGDLKRMGVETQFGHHNLSLLENIDAICVSGGVPLDIPIIEKAREKNIPLTNDSQIFMESTNANIIGITGSAGKTTTTVMIGEIAKKGVNFGSKVWVGGNIGFPMIDYISEIQRDDWVILELSSFQLELMTISPSIAVILNITPNHLDRHESMQAYIDAKQHILDYQNQQDVTILNHDDNISASMMNQAKGRVITFSYNHIPGNPINIYIKDDMVVVRDSEKEIPLVPTGLLRLPGRHNIYNMLAACAASYAAGFPSKAMEQAISSIEGIPHRLQIIAESNGVRWINDSIATTPERVIAALNAIPSPWILLLGGRDKNLPWDELLLKIQQERPQVILFGEASSLIHSQFTKLSKQQNLINLFTVENLDEAVKKASEISLPGDTVLLSPGCTSYDAYRDFEERGEHFIELVKEYS